jgi:hypothetical protein
MMPKNEAIPTLRNPHRARGCVLADEGGAIALLAVFMAVFGVAILYSFVGTVEALSFREGMQDAADAAAFDAAVIHARGMNFIVLINVVMAALMAVLVAIKVLEGLCILGMFLAAALAWPTFGASLALLVPLAGAEQSLEAAYSSAKPAVDAANSVLNTVAGAVASATPAVAEAIVEADIAGGDMAPADTGVVLGSSLTSGVLSLPVEDDSFDELCKRGRETVVDVITAPLHALDPSGFVVTPLKAAAGAISDVLAPWLCGGGSSQSPSIPKTVELIYPRTDSMNACEDPQEGDNQDAACNERTRFEQRSAPDPLTGECGNDSVCTLGGEYDERVHQARLECDPTSPPPDDRSASAPFLYWYEVREGRVTYTWDPKLKSWKRGEATYDPPTAFPPNLTLPLDDDGNATIPSGSIPPEAAIPPCGPEGIHPRIAVGYNATVRNSNDVNEVRPVCTTDAPPLFPEPGSPGGSVEVKFKEVVNILGCKRKVSKQISTGGGTPSSDDPGQTPKRVLSDATLGDERFLLRSFMHGSFGDERAGRIVRLALHGRAAPSDPLAALAPLRNFSVAEAEYFYNDNDGREGWMWKMRWRARLRRFRVPATGLTSLLGGFCPGDGCSESMQQLERMSDVIAH